MEIGSLYGLYRSMHKSLPIIKSTYIQKDLDAFSYCQARKYFVQILPFDHLNKAIMIEMSLAVYNQSFFADLVGGSVRDGRFIETAQNLVSAQISNNKSKASKVELEEFYPLAFLENEFIFEGKKHVHLGIAFIARIDSRTYAPDQFQKNIKFINSAKNPNFPNPHNMHVFRIASEYIANYSVDNYVLQEQGYARKFPAKAHDAFAKKWETTSQGDSDRLSSAAFIQLITETAKNYHPQKIIDIACGDSDLIERFSGDQGFQLFANDVSWSYVSKIHSSRAYYRNIIFTNYNALSTPFAEKFFDVLLCKNLLHHLRNFENGAKLLKEMQRISRISLVIEPLHPNEQDQLGKEFHDKYQAACKENFECFYYRQSTFKDLLEQETSSDAIKYQIIKTIKGLYYFAVIGDVDGIL